MPRPSKALDSQSIKQHILQACNWDSDGSEPLPTLNPETMKQNIRNMMLQSDSDESESGPALLDAEMIKQNILKASNLADSDESDSVQSPPSSAGSYIPSHQASIVVQDEDELLEDNSARHLVHGAVPDRPSMTGLIYPIDISYLMNPDFWMNLLVDGPRTFIAPAWVDGVIMDIWLIKFWTDLHRDDLRYIPVSYLRTEDSHSSESIKTFRRRFCLPQTGPCPLETVVSFLAQDNHYFTLIVNPSNKTMHILGRLVSLDNFSAQPLDRIAWNLKDVWSQVAQLHGWDFDLDYNVYELNWKQNGYDCGPIVCQVLEHIWIHGFRVSTGGKWLKPALPCCHFMRRRILSDFHDLVLTWSRFEAWQGLQPENLDMTERVFTACIETIIMFNPEDFQGEVLDVLAQMDQQAVSCTSCCPSNPSRPRKRKSLKQSTNWLPLPPGSMSEDESDESESRPPPLKRQKAEKSPMPLEPSQSSPPPPKKTIVKKPLNPHRYALDRFPRPTSPPRPTIPTNSQLLFLSSCGDYDDYETGPTSEVLDPIPNTILALGEIDLVYLANKIVSNPWRTFIDYGYRLKVDFCQAFKWREPSRAHRNLMPVGIKGQTSSPETESTDNFPFPELLDQSRRGGLYQFHDSLNIGPEEMIWLAKEQDDNLILLTGRTYTDRSYIMLDLAKDALPHASVEVEKVIDIDSVIWVARRPRFCRAVSIFTKPVIRNRAPIFKHNHLFVKLLLPQSEEDRLAEGTRREWVEQKIKLCNIPHVHFGKTPDSCNLYLAFPRMYHKHPYINRFESLIPPHIQNILWERLIIPAMELATPDVSHTYVGLDLSHLAMKSSSKQMTSYPFRPPELSKLLSFMEDTIKDSDGRLDQFGSFFFVLEAKGIKALTKELVSDHGGNVEDTVKKVLGNLKMELNSLDWNFMADRAKGELFVDLGITYHPKGDSPLVGLWCLDHLEASYGAGGYNLGQMHHHSTLSRYGGLQAEMSSAHSHQSHIIFRSSYNLAYEAVRQADNSRQLFKDTDVSNISEHFIQESNKLLQVFKGTAQRNSYGLRDEFRLGYSALQALGGHLGDLIKDFEASEPFIWLHSKTWFEFNWRRLDSLFQCQMQLYHRTPVVPSNYGIMSILFAFLMQSTLFTPPFIRPEVKKSLVSLNFAPFVNRFGMFFLHDLDMSKELCLPEVAEEDDSDLLSSLGYNPVRARSGGRRDPLWQEGYGEENNEEMYPLGENLTWNELKAALLDVPWVILRKWSWPGDLDQFCQPEGLASTLFKIFTAQIWASLNGSYKWGNASMQKMPDTLEEAMSCWSLGSLQERLKSYMVIPCNCPVRGKGAGRRAPSFEERTSLYFVEEGQELNKRWAPFGQNPGYIARYRMEKSKLGEEEQAQLDLDLGKMLSYCQCLPNSRLDNEGGIWEVKRGKVVLLSNPHYWKVRLVGLFAPGKKRRARGAAAHTTNKQLSRALLELEGYSRDVAEKTLRMEGMMKRMQTRKNRTWKAKNFRAPPLKKGKKRNLKENVDEEGEEERHNMDVERGEDSPAEIELSDENTDESDGTSDGTSDGLDELDELDGSDESD